MDETTLPSEADPSAPIMSATRRPRSLGRRFWEFPVTRIFAYLLLTGALTLLLSLPLRWILRIAHLHLNGQAEVMSVWNEMLVAAAAVGAFYLMSRWGDPPDARASGFERTGLVSETAAGLLIGAGVFSLVMGVLAVLGAFHVRGYFHGTQLWLPLALFLFVAVFEETVFRGYIFQTLELRWGSAVALGVSALLFGFAHLANPVAGLTPAERLAGPVFIVFEASILMSAAYLLSRRLWLPIGIHWGWNYFENTVFGTTDSGMAADPHYTLLHSTLSGPFWLTGGSFGPEASTVCLVVSTAAGLFLLRQAIHCGQRRPLNRKTQEEVIR